MTVAHVARLWVQRLGLDIQRYPHSDPLHGVSLLLAHLGVDLVLDVGANDGGYARTLRRLGYRARIMSFEPVAEPFTRLTLAAERDALWDVVRCAVGDRDGDILVHVAGNDGASSSVLPMLATHEAAAPGSSYIADERVRLCRLDDLVRNEVKGRRCFLKVDVQGYERAVLDGASDLLVDDRLLGVQAEMSLVPLYEGSLLWRETVDLLSDRGFELASLIPGFTDPTSGRLLQADGVFVRPS